MLLCLLFGLLCARVGSQSIDVVGISWDIDGAAPGAVYSFSPNGTSEELAPFRDNLRTLDSVVDDAGTLHLVVLGCTLVPFHVANKSFGAPVHVDCARCVAGCCFEEWHYMGDGTAAALAVGWRGSDGASSGMVFGNFIVSIELATGTVREIMPFALCSVISAASAYSRSTYTLWAWLGCDTSSEAASLIAFDIAAPSMYSRNQTWVSSAKFALAPLLPTRGGGALLGLLDGVGWVRIEKGGLKQNMTAPLPGIAEDHTALLMRTAATDNVGALSEQQAQRLVASVVVFNGKFVPPRRQISFDVDSGELLSSVPIDFGVRELHAIAMAAAK